MSKTTYGECRLGNCDADRYKFCCQFHDIAMMLVIATSIIVSIGAIMGIFIWVRWRKIKLEAMGKERKSEVEARKRLARMQDHATFPSLKQVCTGSISKPDRQHKTNDVVDTSVPPPGKICCPVTVPSNKPDTSPPTAPQSEDKPPTDLGPPTSEMQQSQTAPDAEPKAAET